MDVAVLGEHGEELGADEVGELTVRGAWPGMTKSLWNDDERFIETYWSRFPDVWVHGDWASFDERGQWFLHGRSDDTLNIGGQRLGPAEAEAALTALDEIADAAAVAVPHDVKGQAMWCFVVPAGETVPDEAELAGAVAAALGKPFRPDRVLVVGDLPRTRSQKILRRVVRAIAVGGDTGRPLLAREPGRDRARRRGGEAATAGAEDHVRRRRHLHRCDRRRLERGGSRSAKRSRRRATWSTVCAPASRSPPRARARARGRARRRPTSSSTRPPRRPTPCSRARPRRRRCCAPRASPTCSCAARAARCVRTTSAAHTPTPTCRAGSPSRCPSASGSEGEVVTRSTRRRCARSAHRLRKARDRGGRGLPDLVDRQPRARARRRLDPRRGAAGRAGHPLSPAQPGRARVPAHVLRCDRRFAEAADAGAPRRGRARAHRRSASPASSSPPTRSAA